jgi:hypothetical protein
MSSATLPASEPLLRTLAPALRQLEGGLRSWLSAPHACPLSTLNRANLEGLAGDLGRSAQALDVDRPLLVIVLMGGTGVGKSTLLNALAGGNVAQASFVRPTTRDPVIYYHESIRPDRLDPAIQLCRLIAHDRAALESKIIVDTPDLDSNDLENREKLKRILPIADVVLYVGSQEKYHDQLGWALFLEQRQRRAFAFVLNKWDRCLHGEGGVRPDDDLLRDLGAQGFNEPILFRTSAQLWTESANGIGQRNIPTGEQFGELVGWLEKGLTRLEIEAIKARGVGQLLHQLQEGLTKARPPDLSSLTEEVRSTWERILDEEAAATVEILLGTLDPYQRDLELHFALEGQRRFRGMMAGYLNLTTRLRYLGSTLRNRFSVVPRSLQAGEQPASWDMAAFTRNCCRLAGDLHLDARGKALPNRLLLAADKIGFPLAILNEPTEATAKQDWQQRHAQELVEILRQVEREWAQPVGIKRWTQNLLVRVADWLPLVALLAACARLLWRYFADQKSPELGDALLLLLVPLVSMIILHLLMIVLLPLRWPAIRGEFQRRLIERVRAQMHGAYVTIPADVSRALQDDRRHLEKLADEVAEVARWLRQREQAANIEGLYGAQAASEVGSGGA